MRWYIERGITAQRDLGSEAKRRRQMYSISFLGREESLGRSTYEESGLIPVPEDLDSGCDDG